MWPFGRRDSDEADRRKRFRDATRRLEGGERSEAIRILAEVVEEHPDDLASRVNLGAAYYGAGEYVAAARQFEAAQELEPENLRVLLNLAAARSALDQVDAAIDLLLQILEIDPQFRDVHYNLALAYGRKNRLPEAMAELEMELALHPDHEAAREQMERLKAMSGDAGSSAAHDPDADAGDAPEAPAGGDRGPEPEQ